MASQFRFSWIVLIIAVSAAVVMIGIQDINRFYQHRRTSDAEAHRMIEDLYGRVDLDRLSRIRRREHQEANRRRRKEADGVLRFLRTLLP